MSLEKTKWWKTPPYSNIVGGLAVAAILGVIKIGYDWYTKIEILYTFKEWIDFIIESLLSLANYPLKLWWIFTFIFGVSVLILVNKLLFGRDHKKSSNQASLINVDEYYQLKNKSALTRKLDYVAAKFDNYIWRWDWILNDLIQDYEVKNIAPCCPKLECENNILTLDMSGFAYSCKKCKTSYIVDSSIDTVTKLVEIEAEKRMSPYYETIKKI